MSVTFSGAFTFSGGGFTATLAPPPSVATAGWFGGGFSPGIVSTVDRIIFATDTATASVRGPLTATNSKLMATGSITNGYFGGGYVPSPIAYLSTVNRITYSTDTATASTRGPLSISVSFGAATTDVTTYGWFGGGTGPGTNSALSRVTFATDSNTAVNRGSLTISDWWQIAATGNPSYGWFGGGIPQPAKSTVNRIDYANDTATASVRGPLSSARYGFSAVTDSSTYGWYVSGYGGGWITTIDRITYANDTATASVRGPISSAKYTSAGTCDNTYGWIGGGQSPPGFVLSSIITRITYATDTATSTDRGNLSLARSRFAGASGIQ